MSFILIPNNGEDLKVNAWNWRPTILLLHHATLIDGKQHELMGCNGCGGSVNSETATELQIFWNSSSRRCLPARESAPTSRSPKPKKLAVFTANSKIEDFDAGEIYSATYEWLLMFRDFCRTSEGFRVN